MPILCYKRVLLQIKDKRIGLKKIIFRLLFGIIVFLGSLISFNYLLNREITIELDSHHRAGKNLPVIFTRLGDYLINPLLGYNEAIPLETIRESVSPVASSGNIELAIRNFEGVKDISFKLYSQDGKTELENTAVKDITTEGNLKIARLEFATDLVKEKEYQLEITLHKLIHNRYEPIYYYMRIYQGDVEKTKEYLEFTRRFYKTTLGEDTLNISQYMEEDGYGGTYAHSSLKSGFDAIKWVPLSPKLKVEPYVKIIELNQMSCQLIQNYVVEVSIEEDSSSKLLEVEEFYRMRKGDTGVILFDYSRDVRSGFEQSNASFSPRGVLLGMNDINSYNVMTSPSGQVATFISAGELYSYGAKLKAASQIYSNKNMESGDIRQYALEEDIKVIQVSDSGDVLFYVYGHMSQGPHEGASGLAIYEYIVSSGAIREISFIKLPYGYDYMRNFLDEIVDIYEDKDLLVKLGKTIYQINIETGEKKILIENIHRNQYILDTNQGSLVWQSMQNQVNIQSLLSKEGKSIEVMAPEGFSIRPITFIGSDIICGIYRDNLYGKLYESEDSTKYSMLQPLDALWILNTSGERIREYVPSGQMIGQIYMEENMLRMDLVSGDSSRYLVNGSDFIMNNFTGQRSKYSITSSVLDENYQVLYLTEAVTTLDNEFVVASQLYQKEDKYIQFEELHFEDQGYYVYGLGHLQKVTTSLAEALNLADNLYGSVLDSQRNYVWVRGLKNFEASVGIETVPNIFKTGTTDIATLEGGMTDGRVLDLRGVSQEILLYYVSQGSAILGIDEGDKKVLILGYDAEVVTIYDIESGQTEFRNRFRQEEVFAEKGNQFFSYIFGK